MADANTRLTRKLARIRSGAKPARSLNDDIVVTDPVLKPEAT